MMRLKDNRWIWGGFMAAAGAAATLALPLSAQNRDRAADRPAASAPKGQEKARLAADSDGANDISMDEAVRAVTAAVQKAQEINTKMDIAVVDAGGNLKAFIRMDDAWIGSIDIAQKKAKTARYFDMPTGEIGKLSQPGGPLYNIEVSNGGLITFPGGIPIKNGAGKVIGAIGVSGSTVENDHAVAEAGVDALK